MSTPTREFLDLALAHIQLAQDNLSAAARMIEDLPGYDDQWRAIDAHYTATKALWHRINDTPAPLILRASGDPKTEPGDRRRRCLDDKPDLHD
jgi:hypothetical protein